jgi:type III secretion system FlhB-like substrate exporter
MSIFNSEEKRIKKQIMDRAKAMAVETYKKDLMFRTLQASDLHYAIIEDLMKSANLVGEVVIKMKDGTEIKIKSDDNARANLNKMDQQLF